MKTCYPNFERLISVYRRFTSVVFYIPSNFDLKSYYFFSIAIVAKDYAIGSKS